MIPSQSATNIQISDPIWSKKMARQVRRRFLKHRIQQWTTISATALTIVVLGVMSYQSYQSSQDAQVLTAPFESMYAID